MCAFDKLVYGIYKQGFDERKLGRWSYFTIEGKCNTKTIFITCYCPVKGSSPGSAYAQQLVYIANNRSSIPDDITCPRQLFGYDLSLFLSQLNDQGVKIVLMGDFNSDYPKLEHWMSVHGLFDVVKETHGPCPITYNRSSRDPLDAIFASAHIVSRNNGFLSFGRLAGDHRGVWADIPEILIYGHNPPQPTHLDLAVILTSLFCIISSNSL